MSTPICWLVLTVLATCITALTIKQRTSPETYDLAPRDVCDGFVGNPDLYGLGIRVGIYLQWVSSLLINVYVPAEMADALDTNSIFVFAVFIAIAVVTSSTEGLHPAEAFIMLQMCFGYLLSVLSVSGLRVTLLSDPQSLDTDIWRAELSKKKGFLTSVSGRYAEISELFKVPFKDPPESADISSWSIGMFRVLDSWTFHAIVSINSTRGSFDASFWALQPVLWMFDLYVFLWAALEEDSGVITDPKKIFRRERFQDYQRKRALAIGCLKPKLFSLGLESSFKNDQTSWFGVCWRSCLVAGIAVYNVWFWFGGIDILRGPTATCTAYIFLFSKVDILGGAGVFFKIFSIVYIAYAGVLFATCCLVMLAFLGTTLRSVMINLVVLPYARLVLFAASLGSKDAERKLEKFDEARGKFLDWLGIPSIRQLLSGYAYLSSNPKDAEPTDVIMDAANGHTWITTLSTIFKIAILLVVVWSIIAVELTLTFNSITGVYDINSTGQLIPFVIGIVGMGRTTHLISLDLIKKLYPKWSQVRVIMDAQNNIVITDVHDVAPVVPQEGLLPKSRANSVELGVIPAEGVEHSEAS